MKNFIKLCAATILIIVMISACVVVSSAATTTATEEEWIEIRTIEDLYNVRNDLSAKYILMNDIDLTEATAPGGAYDYQGYGWNPLGTFTGTFDGNGHKIIGMRIVVNNTQTNYGLFTQLKGATIKNLGMVDGSISGSNSSSGSLDIGFIAGKMHYGTIENCYNTGEISGRISTYYSGSYATYLYVGGIVGNASLTKATTSTISNCYNTGSISITPSFETVHAGGIAGKVSGYSSSAYMRIFRSYNTGDISETTNTDACGIARLENYSSITDCYTIGDAEYGVGFKFHGYGLITNSYYLGTYSSTKGGEALNESQISNKAMYTGFDFENDWIIDNNANYTYPQLRSNPQDLSKTIESINLGSLPTKTNYLTGDALDLTGGYVNIKYSSGLAGTEQVAITEDMVSGFDTNKIGEQTLTVTYEGQTWNYTIDMACRHDFSTKNTDNIYFKSAATCTSAEKYYYSCSNCGEIGTESFDNGVPLPHTFTEQITTSDYLKSLANCIEPAIFYYSCECGEKGNETFTVGSPTTHTYDREITNNTYLVSAADCLNAAVYYKSCVCGKAGSDTFTYGSALGHIGGSATCTAPAICNRCGNNYGDVIPHTYNRRNTADKYLKSPATCTALAVYYKSCSCGEMGSATFEAGVLLSHEYDEQLVSPAYLKSNATCTSAAVYYYSCECGEKGSETFTNGSPLPHTYNKSTVDTKYVKAAADCENAAVYYKSCSCGKAGSETFTSGNALGHTGGVASCTEQAICSRCEQYYGSLASHDYNQNAAEAKYLKSNATCTQKAVYYKSCVCGKASVNTFEHGETLPHNHNQQNTDSSYLQSEATCLKKATYYYSCSCGDRGDTTFEYGSALGHSYGTEWYTNTIKHWHKCTRCNAEGEKLDHTPGDAATCTTAQICLDCEIELADALGHTEGDEASCTTAQICTSCGDVLANAKGHTAGSAATCTEPQVCLECGVILANATGHTAGALPTCTTTQNCIDCGEILTNAYGHVPGNEATCTTAQICLVCYDILEGMRGHTAGDAATCTTNQICIICNEILEFSFGHTAGDEPTCTTAQICIICLEELEPALGHSYHNDNDIDCNVCGDIRDISTDTEKPTQSPDNEKPTEQGGNSNLETPTEDSSEGTQGDTDNGSDKTPVESPTDRPADYKVEVVGGCASSMGIGMIGLVTAISAAFILTKKKK